MPTSTLGFLVFLAFLVIAGALWRTISTHLADRPIGKAMGFIY